MLYLNHKDVERMGVDWVENAEIIKKAIFLLRDGDYIQPIKPYLRYRDLGNRIIAMPAFIGGDFNVAGIKWIASFPKNIEIDLPRASSIIILNDSTTGVPIATINTPLLSIYRTTAVSAFVIQKYLSKRPARRLKVAVIGLGPIGQCHIKMCTSLFGEWIDGIHAFDVKDINVDHLQSTCSFLVIEKTWEDAYDQADIVITCTVADRPYIHSMPKPGSLLLNVSLRDFKTSIYESIKDSIIVDKWEEVCRENTDVERMHLEKGLTKEMTYSIVDLLEKEPQEIFSGNGATLFNPMGLAIFDLAVASFYYTRSIKEGIGTKL